MKLRPDSETSQLSPCICAESLPVLIFIVK